MGNCWSYQSNPANFPDEFLAAVNYFRSHHILTPLLRLDLDLCKRALAEANLAAYYKHKPEEVNKPEYKSLIEKEGQITWARKFVKDEDELASCPFAAPQFWYDEICNFKFGESGQQTDGVSGNVTAPNFQTLIWRTTRRVGVGFATSKDESIAYVVAMFDGDYGSDSNSINQIKRPVTGLPALKIDLQQSLTEGAPFKLILRGYEKWLLENVNDGLHMGIYLKNNPWAEELWNKAVSNKYPNGLTSKKSK